MRRDGGLDILFNYNILAVEGHPLGVRSDTSQPSKTMKKDGRGQKYLNGKERAPQTQERREEVSKSSSSAVVPGKGVSRHDTSATPAPSERRFPSTPAGPIVFLDFSPNPEAKVKQDKLKHPDRYYHSAAAQGRPDRRQTGVS